MDQMNEPARTIATNDPWGPYPNYVDIARFEYGRRMWRYADMRERLLRHWLDERHPYRHRFLRQRELIEEVLASRESPEDLQGALLKRGTSLRCVAREIPPVFGSFFSSPASTA
jgi:hypothetical protein